MTGQRWATFDCYGTLIDWNLGIRTELERVFGVEAAPRLLLRYHELEPKIEAEEYRTYREVLRLTLEELLREEGLQLPEGEARTLADSLPDWPPFPEVPAALTELRNRGWMLAILSNSDRDLIESSIESIGVPFDLAIVASEIGSYKPAHEHWGAFAEQVGRLPDVHVAQSHFHDVVPATALGIPTVWINRLGERAEPAPTRQLTGLTGLADTLDELAP